MRFIILIVVALVMAFVMFGRNPIKELQQQELERRKKYGADPVTQQTNMYIEQQKYQSGGALPRSNAVAAPDGTIPDAGDNVMVKTTSDGVVINPPTKDNSSQEIPSPLLSEPTTNGYYPPIIGGASPKTIQDNAIADGLRLRSGQKLSFDGMNVYAVDKAGNKTPLPDGNYTLYDGSEIVVRGGRRILNSISN